MAASVTTSERLSGRDRTSLWHVAVLLVSAPLLVTLCVVIWRSPYPLSEAVSIFEDVTRAPVSRFFQLDTSYYRPLFYAAVSTLWHNAGSLATALDSIKLLHIVPIVLLVLLLIWHLRPRTALDAAAAALAVAVLVGAPGFRDNLEIPLSYTIVGMPAALLVWMVLEREYRIWHGPVIVALVLLALGFKEQGLVLVPLVVAAWWAGAPGVRRHIAVAMVILAAGYVALRLMGSGSWPLFQQDVGYGFTRLSPDEAAARFGAFPVWIFAYSGMSTIANVLFSEPSGGVFRIVQGIVGGRPSPLDLVELLSSVMLTVVIAWWAIGSVRRRPGWSAEGRLVIGTCVVLAACGALSFDYSRDRLGGMAVPFYALSAFYACRAAAEYAMTASPKRLMLAGTVLVCLAAAWQIRAVATVESVRETSSKSRREWITGLQRRRAEFVDRPVYTQTMESMIEQGTDPSAPEPTRYRRSAARLIRGR